MLSAAGLAVGPKVTLLRGHRNGRENPPVAVRMVIRDLLVTPGCVSDAKPLKQWLTKHMEL